MARFLFIIAALVHVLLASSDSIDDFEYNIIFLNAQTLLTNRKLAQLGFYQGNYYRNEDLSLAVKRFISVADTALATPRVSTTQKMQTPPSGDKHDYYSQALYYWPNNYTRGGWPYIHRGGLVNPEAELIPDSKNFEVMCNKFSQLALMYFYSGNTKYAQGAVEFVRTWFLAPNTAMTPHLKYASTIPGFLGIRGEGIIELHNIVFLFDYIELVKPSGLWTTSIDVAWRTWLTQYFNWLITDSGALMEATRTNNHGTFCALQLVTISLYLNNLNFAGSLIGNIQNLLDDQMGPDQSFPRETSKPKSFFYSVLNLKGFFALATVAEQFGFDLWNYNANGNSLQGALDYLIAHYNDWPHPDILGPPVDQHNNDFLTLLVKAKQVWGSKYNAPYNSFAMTGGGNYIKHASQVVLQYYLTQTPFTLSPMEFYFELALMIYGAALVFVCLYYFFLFKIWYKSADEIEEERLKKRPQKPKVVKPSSPKSPKRPASPQKAAAPAPAPAPVKERTTSQAGSNRTPAAAPAPAPVKTLANPPVQAAPAPKQPSPKFSRRQSGRGGDSERSVAPPAPVPVAAPPAGEVPIARRRRSSG